MWSAYEPGLLRKINACLKPNDILVADAIYGAYVEIALLQHQLVDSVFCLHGSRKVDFRQGQRVGKKDGLFTLGETQALSPSLSTPLFDRIPSTLRVRILRFTIDRKGFRARPITVVTTLLDPRAYPKNEIARLYGLRWEAEINLRHLKSNVTS